MQQSPVFTTERHTLSAIFSFLIACFIAACASYLIVTGLVRDKYPQLLPILLGSGFELIALRIFFLSFYTTNRIFVYQDYMEVFSAFGFKKRKIGISDITNWKESLRPDKEKSLTIFTHYSSYKIRSSDFNEYELLKETLTTGKSGSIEPASKKKLFLAVVIFALLGLPFTISSIHIYATKDDKIRTEDLTTISGIIVNPVKVLVSQGRGGTSHQINIVLNKYPDFYFSIDDETYSAMYVHDYISNVHKGDSLYIEILTDDYRKKITHTSPLTLWDKTISYKYIRIYGLCDQNKTYLKPDDYNNLNKLNSKFYTFTGMALFFFLLSLIVLSKAVNKKPQAIKG